MHEERQVKKYVNERQFYNSQNVTARSETQNMPLHWSRLL